MATASRRTTWTAVIFGGVALVGAVMLVVAAASPTTSIGWFAYAPLSNDVFFSGDAVVVTRTAAIGAVLVSVGLIGLAFTLGVRIGARRPRE